MRTLAVLLLAAIALPLVAADPPKVRVLIVDGQNNHNWQATSPVLKRHLEDGGRFAVDVATTPAKGKKEEMAKFAPDVAKYDVVVSNYNGEPWPDAVNTALESRLKEGQLGLVIVHAANNSFAGWKEYNRMIGMGWRDAKFGKRLKYDDAGQPEVVEAGKDR